MDKDGGKMSKERIRLEMTVAEIFYAMTDGNFGAMKACLDLMAVRGKG